MFTTRTVAFKGAGIRRVSRITPPRGAPFAQMRSMTIEEQLIRLGSAVLAGGALGLNRKVGGKSAGMRTHGLVSLGAALAVLAGVMALESVPGADRGAITRTMQGVISGIGFIGAGAILKGTERGLVRGLTTAASIWLAAAVGIASGAGFCATALLATALGLLVLIGGRPIERASRRVFQVDHADEERRNGADRRDPPDGPGEEP
jgi:putative Mg2+ transporter-C (MgtC) family protein